MRPTAAPASSATPEASAFPAAAMSAPTAAPASSAAPASAAPAIPAGLAAALEPYGLHPEAQLGEGGCGVVFRTRSLPDTSHQTITPSLAHWLDSPNSSLYKAVRGAACTSVCESDLHMQDRVGIVCSRTARGTC